MADIVQYRDEAMTAMQNLARVPWSCQPSCSAPWTLHGSAMYLELLAHPVYRPRPGDVDLFLLADSSTHFEEQVRCGKESVEKALSHTPCTIAVNMVVTTSALVARFMLRHATYGTRMKVGDVVWETNEDRARLMASGSVCFLRLGAQQEWFICRSPAWTKDHLERCSRMLSLIHISEPTRPY